jgi:hypothetical protein
VSITNTVEKHYARFLGTPRTGYNVSLKAHPEGAYDILEYNGVPSEDVVALATFGFSAVPLHMFRQELLVLCYERFASGDLVRSLAGIVETVAAGEHPLMQGEVLTLAPKGPIDERSSMVGFYSAVPSYFPDEFQLVDDNDMSVDIGWLIPLYQSEVDWIGEHGWEAFEVLLLERDPDVLDLARPALF